MATLSDLREQREHWSFSSIQGFLNCSLAWAFLRVYKIAREFTPANMSLGSVFHRTCEWVYLSRKEGRAVKPKEATDLFSDLWSRQLLEDRDIKFGEDDNAETCGEEGRKLAQCLVENSPGDELVLFVNEVFAVPLVDREGNSLEKPIIGEIDFGVQKNGKTVLGDWKTSARRWPKDKAAKDLQPTCSLYAYWKLKGVKLPWIFRVLIKNKMPLMEDIPTERNNEEQFYRLVETVRTIEKAVAAEIFLPNEQSFYCGNCQYHTACKAWHRNKAKLISIGTSKAA